MSALEDLQHTGVFRPADEPALRWGVLGTGWIAGAFVDAAHRHTHQRFVAAASRTPGRSAEFAAAHEVARAYDSYSALIDDPEVDVVYLAMTADQHCGVALEAIAAGKSVLIEKPIGVNATEAALIREAARSAGVFVMEALWSRYLPQYDALRLLLERGDLGEIELVSADHAQPAAADPASRMLRADLGGGALLDLGVYPLQLASCVLGNPASVLASGHIMPSGVDGTVAMILSYPGSTAKALLSTSLMVRSPTTAEISGTEARLEMAGPFHIPTGFTLTTPGWGDEPLRWQDESGIALMDGLSYEATALARFVAQGRTESPVFGLDDSVAILETIDTAREMLGA